MGENAVLVVDDDEQIGRLLSRVLERGGYPCTTVTSVPAARDALADGTFGVALLDVRMGQQSGLSFALELLEGDLDVAVLMLTGLDDRETARVALEAGAAGYLIKPFTPNEILINVASALRRRELTIDNRRHREHLERLVDARTAELLESEQRFRLLAENVQDVIYRYRIRPNVGVDYISPAIEALTGYAPEEFYARPGLLFDIVHEEDRPKLAAAIESMSPEPVVLRWVHRDGRVVWMDGRNSPLHDETGRLVALQGVARDITEQRRAQEELRRTDEERRRLLSSLVTAQEEERQRIAGDIHDDSLQVMTGVGMRLHALLRRLEDPEMVAMIDKLEDVVDLSISRLRHMLFELRPPTLDREGLGPALRLYVDQTRTEGGPAYTVRDELRREPCEESRVVLYRITQEVLTNARKHSDAAVVEILLQEREGGVLVTVRDDGRGFDPVSASAPRPGHLGLSAIRERAEMAGGWARVESEPGEGATIRFWTPSGFEAEERAAG